MAGFAVFAVASFVGGLAESGEMLIAARAAQGLGAAILSPAALSLVMTTFAEGAERNKALGVWGAVAAGGGAAGSLLGGVITQWLGWEWVLWINTPIGIAAALVAPLVLAESRVTTGARSFDALGAITVTGGLVALVYGVIEGIEPAPRPSPPRCWSRSRSPSAAPQPAGPVRALPQRAASPARP